MDKNPIVSQPIVDLVVAKNETTTTVDLFQHFDDPITTGKVARFELIDSSLGGGVTNVLLFDQDGAGAPKTVANFSNYVEGGDYLNSIIHRSVPGFIIQGGGFTVNDLAIGQVVADPAVVNEFSQDRSNLRGTIAMAKLGDDPNSATSEWFFNLADNAENLDNQNGGFTVFGEVLTDGDLAPVDAIASLPIIDVSSTNSAFTDLPVITDNLENPGVDTDANLARYSKISIEQQDELKFEVLGNSNPDLLGVSVDKGKLALDYIEGQSGTAEISVKATDLLGDSIEDTFVVTVEDLATTEGQNILGTNADDTIDGGEGNDTLRGAEANDSIFGIGGNDWLSGWIGNDFIDGGSGVDSLTGGSGDDTIFGGADQDTIYSEIGNDISRGNVGDDYLGGGFGNDKLSGDEGNDTLRGGASNDTLSGDGDNDMLQGGNWDDTLNGGVGDDMLQGDGGYDGLDAGAGNDTLMGGLGVDLFTGGGGSDTFVIANEKNSSWILDFEAGIDKIGLADGIVYEDLAIGGTNSTFVGYKGTNIAILPDFAPAGLTKASFEPF